MLSECCEFKSCSGKVYSMQHYVIKIISDLRQVGGFHNRWVFFYRRLKKPTSEVMFVVSVVICYILLYTLSAIPFLFLYLFLAMNNLALNKYFVYVVELKKIVSENNCFLRNCCFMLLKFKILWVFCQGNYEKKF